jgi:hypothetical protein
MALRLAGGEVGRSISRLASDPEVTCDELPQICDSQTIKMGDRIIFRSHQSRDRLVCVGAGLGFEPTGTRPYGSRAGVPQAKPRELPQPAPNRHS